MDKSVSLEQMKLPMSMPVSVRLDDEVRAILESAAKASDRDLSTYLCDLATEEARRLRRERIKAQSRAVGEHVVRSADAAEFYADWGSPTAKIDP